MADPSPRLADNQNLQVQQTQLLADVGRSSADTLCPLDSHVIIVSPETRLTSTLKSNRTTLPVKPSDEPIQADSVSNSKEEEQEPSHSKTGQPTVATLAKYGIKVIDFAYVTDSTLTTPMHVPQRRNVGVRYPKRPRKAEDVGDVHGPKKSRSLERQVTEPVIGVPLRRSRAYTDIRLANWVRDDTIHVPVASNSNTPASWGTSQGRTPQVNRRFTPDNCEDPEILLSTPQPDDASQDSSHPISALPTTPPRLPVFSYLLPDASPPALSYSQSQDTSQSQPYVTTPPLSRHGSGPIPWPIVNTSPVVNSQQQQGLEFLPQIHVIDQQNPEGFEFQASPLSSKPSVLEPFDHTISNTGTALATSVSHTSLDDEQSLRRYQLRKRSALTPSPPRPSTRGVSRQLSQLSLSKESTHAPTHKKQRGGKRGRPRSAKKL